MEVSIIMSNEYPLNVPAPHHFTFAVRDIPDVTVEQRERVLKATHYNEFAFPAGMLTVDMLSDSGTTAMTNHQWASLFLGDEAYGRNTGYYVLLDTFRDIFERGGEKNWKKILDLVRTDCRDVETMMEKVYLPEYEGGLFNGGAAQMERPNTFIIQQGRAAESVLMEIVKKILADGFAYESNGSVYFDVEKYNRKYSYGRLSGRNLDDILTNTRELDGQGDKRHSCDFALWKKASPEHIMRWPSPWSDGFPGWHMECSAMSTKYLGQRFDIHGGGMDLMFPHHECEIAQSTAALGHDSAKYWIHNNMITINGQKMGKSLGNFITLEELFTGNHKLLTQAYSPMTIRFFVLQAHYRSTLDFSNEALQAAEKGLDRLMKAVEALDKIKPSEQSTVDPAELETRCREALDDDLNSPMAISALFDWVRIINQLVEGQQRITAADLEKLREIVRRYVFDILGLRDEKAASAGGKDLVTPLVNMLLDLRQAAKTEKNWALSDKIRDELTAIGIRVKDRKDGCDWEIE